MSIDRSELKPLQAASGDSAYVDALAFNAAEAAKAADAKAAEEAEAKAAEEAEAKAAAAEAAGEVSPAAAALAAGPASDEADTSTAAGATSEQQQHPKEDRAGTAGEAVAQPPASDSVVAEAQPPATLSLPQAEQARPEGLHDETAKSEEEDVQAQSEDSAPSQPTRPEEEVRGELHASSTALTHLSFHSSAHTHPLPTARPSLSP